MQQRLSGETAQAPRLLKRSLPFVILALVLSVLYFAPQLPIVRAWLLSFVINAAESAGYDMRIDEHSGNPWSGLNLEDVDVSGPGLNVSVDELAASYYLPGLITRKLPLSLSAEGVRGDITLSEFEPSSSSSSGGSAVITPILRRLSLRDVALTATDVPYTLPDLTLSRLEARTNGTDPITATALLTTPEGNMNVEGTVNLSPFEIVADIPRADVRIARQWWDGIEGGTLSGQFRYDDGNIEADAVVADGAIAFLGEEVTNLEGPVRLRYPTIDANLTGQTLGGTVEATGGVDIDALRWFGEATGEVALRDTALWLAEGRLPLDLSVIPMTGRADAQVRASGWTSVNVSGVAQGAGSLATYPLENLLVDFEYDTETATRTTITGDLAGGDVTAQLLPTSEGFTFDLNAQNMALLETVFADVTIGLTQDGILSGPTTANLDGQLLGEPVDLKINGDLTPERWLLPITGTAFAGPFEGDITLVDGLLAGKLVGSDLNFSFLDGPITLNLKANGPPTELPLNLNLTTAEPTSFAFGPVRIAETLEGDLTALLRGSLLDDIQGEFGPLNFMGQTLLSGQRGEFSYVLNETEVSGPLEGTFSASSGSLVLQDRNLIGEADLTSSELSLPGITLEPLEAPLTYSFDESWNVALEDAEQGLKASYAGGELELSTNNTPLTIAGQDITLSGNAAADADAVLETLSFDILGLTSVGDVALMGDANEASFELSSEPGSEGLIDALSSVKGSLRLREGTGQFTGRLGDLDLFGSGDFGEAGLRADVTARSGDDTLNLKFAGAPNDPVLNLRGHLPLQPVGNLFGLDLSGQVRADLVQDKNGYSGAATIDTEIANIPADLVVQGSGDRLELSGEARPLDIPVTLSGSLQPTLEISGMSDYGSVQLLQEGWQFSGSGTAPELTRAGFEIGAQSWQLDGSLSDGALKLTLPESDSAAQISWGEGGWQVNSNLKQTVTRGNTVLGLDATASLSAENRAGSVEGVLEVITPSSSDTLSLGGSLEEARLSGTASASAVSSLFESPVDLLGNIALDARVNLLDGAAYRADTTWQTKADNLVATIQGKGADLTVDAQATGLELNYADGTLSIQTDTFNPSAFVSLPSVRGTVSGAFSVTPGQVNQYDGTLSLTTSEPADTRILLIGVGTDVQMSAELERDGAALAASGELLPTLNLDVVGSLSDYAEVSGRVQGAPAKPEFSADLLTQAFVIENQLSLPAQSLQLSGNIDEGLQFQVEGNALRLELTNGNLSGVLDLPVELKGDLHTLTADINGTLNEPRATGRLDGPLINGPVTLTGDQVALSLALNLAPWLKNTPLNAPLATVDLTANTDLSWQVDVAASATFRDLPLSLDAATTGQTLSFSGTGTVNVENSPIPFSLSGQGTDVDLNASLESFDLSSLGRLVPVPLSGQSNGTISFATGGGLSFDVSATGSAQNRAFTLSATQAEGIPLQTQIIAEDLQLELQQLQAANYSIRLTSLTDARNLNLEGVLGLSPALNLDVAGQVSARATTLSATYAPDAGSAAWHVTYDGANVSGEAVKGEAVDEPWFIKATADIPQESHLPVSGNASLQAQLDGSNVDLHFLNASAQFAGRNIDLSLGGLAWPAPLLTGELGVDKLEPFVLTFSDTAQGYLIRAAQNGLELSGDLNSSFGLAGFALTGEGVLPTDPELRLDSNLYWQKDAGFTGQATLSGELAQATTQLVLSGNKSLSVKGGVSYKEADLADLDLSLAPDILSNPALSGLVVVQGDLGKVLPTYSGEALGFGAALDLSGRLSELQLSGPLVLRGALTAEGDLRVIGTEGVLSLEGEGLEAQSQFNSSGWTFSMVTRTLDLSTLVPQLESPQLSTTVEGSQRFGGPLSLRAQPFNLTTASSYLEGNVRYEGGLRGQLETDLNLTDLNLGRALRGNLKGNLSLAPGESAPLISGTLDALNLGLVDQDATLSGNVAINGPLTQPFISSSLNGSGSASGNLYAALDLASSSYDLSSSLAVGTLKTDLNISTEAQRISGSGSLAFGDYRLAFVESEPEQLQLEGQSKLESWLLTAHPFEKSASLTGDLNSVLSQLSGQVNLEANWAADAASLNGTLNNLGFGSVKLGDIMIAPQRGGLANGLNLRGEAVDASLKLIGSQSWTLERLNLPLPGGFQTDLMGSGSLSSAQLTGTVTGNLVGEAAAIPIELAYLNNHLELRSEGELLGGHLALEAVGFPDTGWRGFIRIEDGSLAGFITDIDGALSGAFAAPELRADYSLAQDALVASGSLTATTDAVSLLGEASSSYLGTPLAFQGNLWPEPDLTLAQDTQKLEIFLKDGRLDATGNIDLDIGPVRAELGEVQDAWLTLFLRSRAIEGLAFKTSLATVPPQDLTGLLSEGLFIEGAETTEGYILLSWQDRLKLSAQSLRWLTPAGVVSVSGSLAGTGAGLSGRFSGAWQGNSSSRSQVLPWLASVSTLIFDAELNPESLTISAQGNDTNALLLADLKAQTALLNADWQLPEGDAKLGLKYLAQTGLGGDLRFTNFPIFVNEQTGAARLDAALIVTEGLLEGNAELHVDEGKLALEGKLGLATVLPPSLAPNRDTNQALSIKVDDFDASAIPWLATYVPYLDAPLDGFVSLDNAKLAGTLNSPITIGEDVIPLDIVLGGTLTKDLDLNATGSFGRSSFELSNSPDSLAGLIRFENFPLHKGFEASAGPTDARANLTGALRFDMPERDFRKAYVRFATEQLRIEESNGTVTEGTLSFEIEEQGLTIQEARFEGEGSWVASGEASQEQLNLRIDAQDADFSPFLDLIPQLAGLDAGAFGTLQLVSSGSLINPIIRATSPGLELSLSGSAYNLEDLSLTVQNRDFVTSGRLEGVAPLTGNLRFSGGGQLVLAPERAFDLSLRFQGDPSLPVLGTLSDVSGTISARPGEPWRIESSGVLGQPFSLEGSLTPLDVRISGNGLNLKATQFFLVSSETDTNLRFVWDRALFISGSLLTKRAQLDLDSRERRAESDAPREEQSRGGALSRVFFQNISVRAPQQITFQENFGSGELGNINLMLGGTAATPFLNGNAEALRGTIRFAGRDFSLERSVATFEPSQGIFPTLDIRARSSFNKAQVLSNVRDVEFIEPTGPTFELNLVLAGSLEPNRDGPRPFTVDIEPTLTSNAVIQTVGASSRPLSEPELFSLLSLGRLELSQEFASQGGLATSLAQGAVDTAVDVLILSELQKELGSILGLDLLEIRTTSLSSLFTSEDAGFGVSLRVGGYLSDELFASYQIGSSGLEDGIALSNEFNLRYTLDPLDFSLIGTLDFTDTGTTVPALDLGVGYSLNPTVQFETGVQLSTENLGVRFGVNFRY